ncbi:MAG: ABC transporter ATP-binding protein [Acetobacteraceae bacterium]|nr:ABC transporter ATP-binding protein [Acetobacteraceae bacterium]
MSQLRVENLRKSHGPVPVLDGVDLVLPNATILALLGASGCGKTTLLRLIAGFDPADAGRIVLSGRTLQAPGTHVPAEKRGIGYVPQEGTLFPHLTVAKNVGFGLRRSPGRASRVAEALRLTGLTGLEKRFPHELSGGQQQRTALARALAPSPGLILLDEPFNALDMALRRSVCADVVALLRTSGATAILVTHDPLEAFTNADLVAVMHGGTVAQCADPQTVYRMPADPDVARLTGPVLFLDATVRDGRADTPLGAVPLYPGAPNGKARVMLRPEQIVSVADDRGIAAEVVSHAFRGDHTLVTLALGGGDIELRTVGAAEYRPGEIVHLAIAGPAWAFAAGAINAPP